MQFSVFSPLRLKLIRERGKWPTSTSEADSRMELSRPTKIAWNALNSNAKDLVIEFMEETLKHLKASHDTQTPRPKDPSDPFPIELVFEISWAIPVPWKKVLEKKE